jgi:type III secretion protein L
MLLFKLPSGTSYHTDQKILPPETLGALISLEHLVEDAKKDLETLKADFAVKQDEEIAKKKEEAYLEALTIFNQHIFALDAELKTLKTHLLKQVLPLALNAAKKIVGEQLRLHPDTIVAMIQKQLAACSSCKKVKIIVSKDDKAILDENKASLKEKLDQIESFAIEESADMTQGSCMIITEAGNINASLDLQWKALESAFSRFTKNA